MEITLGNNPKHVLGQTSVINETNSLRCKTCGEFINPLDVKQHLAKHPQIRGSFIFIRSR